LNGEKKFSISFISLSIVGVGSVAFHATMRYFAQALDELPVSTLFWRMILMQLCCSACSLPLQLTYTY
jgi:hypothetical protein